MENDVDNQAGQQPSPAQSGAQPDATEPKGSKRPIVLVANNPFGHHLLTSQLLAVYQALDLDREIILLCNGITKAADPSAFPALRVVSYASARMGALSHLNLLMKFIQLRWTRPDAVYHLRGFVAGICFFLSRLSMLGRSRYIYDPRGAFFIERREAGRSPLMSRVFGWVEDRLIKHSSATIVTSDRFARLYRRLFGYTDKYQVIYNATSFDYHESLRTPADGETLRLVYLGTLNYWHDLDEIFRVIQDVARHVGPDRVDVSIYTPERFHEQVRTKFQNQGFAALTVEYLQYDDIPRALSDKHIGISVVRPTLSTRIASPIKIADYVAMGLLPLLNSGIGDFDDHFATERSAILYKFGEPLAGFNLGSVDLKSNKTIYDLVSRQEAKKRLGPLVESLVNND